MITGREPSPETLALYAMHLLDADERDAVEAWLQSSAAAREELALITGDLAAFSLSAEMHSPPALARQRLLKQIARERKNIPPRAAAPKPAEPPAISPFASYAEQVNNFAARAENYIARPEPLPAREESYPARTESYPTRAEAYPTRAESFAAHPERYPPKPPARNLPPMPPPRRIRRDDSDFRPMGFAAALPYIGWAVAASLAFACFMLYSQRTDLQNNLRTMGAEMTRLETDSAQARAILETLTSPTAQRITLSSDSAAPAQPSGKAIYLPDKGTLTFLATNLAPLQPYKTYELWLIPAGGHDPIPAGTFKPDERGYAAVLLPELPKGVVAKAFGVTIEDDGGSQTPTMPILLSGS